MRIPTCIALAAVFLASCGGDGGSSTPTSPPVPQSQTVSGTTRATSATSCAGGSHNFTTAGGGAVSVTLTQASGGTALMVQVCANGIDNNNCTINQRRIEVGQTVSGTAAAGTTQNLKFLPLNCGGNGPAPADPINYTATLSFLQ